MVRAKDMTGSLTLAQYPRRYESISPATSAVAPVSTDARQQAPHGLPHAALNAIIASTRLAA